MSTTYCSIANYPFTISIYKYLRL